jgi:hypothetical protein
LVLLSGAEEYSFLPYSGLPSGFLSFCFVAKVFQNLHEKFSFPSQLFVLLSLSAADPKIMAEGCLRRFNSHCLIERWHAIVEE